MCRIYVRSCKTTFLNKVNTLSLSWQTINTNKHYVMLLTNSLGCLPCSKSLGIVMTKNTIDIRIVGKTARHNLAGTVNIPIAIDCGCNDIGITFHYLDKSFMTFLNWRRALKTGYLQHPTLTVKLIGNKACHYTTNLYIIGSNICGITVRIDLADEKNNGNSFLICTFNRRRYCTGVARGNNKKVDITFDQTVYLLYLSLGIVVGRTKANVYILIFVLTNLYLTIYLLSPSIVTALRHSYNRATVGT